jgi:hypothetical protein
VVAVSQVVPEPRRPGAGNLATTTQASAVTLMAAESTTHQMTEAAPARAPTAAPRGDRGLRVCLLASTTDGERRRVSRLADDFYLICFQEQTGRAVVTDAVAGLGLAGGLLGELVLGGHLLVHDGLLYPAAGVPAPNDLALWEVLQAVAGQRQPQKVGAWLRFLATDAVTDVRRRMCAAGLLTRVRTHRFGVTGRDRYLPIDSNAAVWPAIRLAGQLCAGEQMPLQDAVLAGLVAATGLLKQVLWDAEHAPGFAHADQLRHLLPTPLAAIVAHTEAAVGQHVLTRRRM